MEDQYFKDVVTYVQLKKVLAKHFTTGWSEEDEMIFKAWLNEDDGNAELWKRIDQQEALLNDLKRLSQIKQNDEEYLRKLHSKISYLSQSRVTWWQTKRNRLLIAASILAVISLAGIWYWSNSVNEKQPEIVTKGGLLGDAEPGTFKARLTLADGSAIVLDSAADGKLAEQGKTVVLNEQGKLVYKGNAADKNKNIYNVLATDKGQIYATTLSDGSTVWLNSATSLRYPVVFNAKERRVELNGEAYFEVTPSTKPFIVSSNGMEIQVLGTVFNVNTYADEPFKRTTLLTGKVKLRSSNTGQLTTLMPGQQGKIDANGTLETIPDVNIQQVIAWKNGYFHFSNDDITTVMRQLARWYNLDVVYEREMPRIMFGGKLPRNAKASVVLRVLEKYNVHFKIEGKRIIVSP